MDPKEQLTQDYLKIMEAVIIFGPSLIDRFVREIEKFEPKDDNARQVQALAAMGVMLMEKEAVQTVAAMMKTSVPTPQFSVN